MIFLRRKIWLYKPSCFRARQSPLRPITLIWSCLPLSNPISHHSLINFLCSSHNLNVPVVSDLHPSTYLFVRFLLLRMGDNDLYSSSKTRLSVFYPVKLSQTHLNMSTPPFVQPLYWTYLIIALTIPYCSYLFSHHPPLLHWVSWGQEP